MSKYLPAITTPVIFLIFNRPEQTEKVFLEIAKARPNKLLVVGDGPRLDKEGDLNKVIQTRAIIEKVDWPCEVMTNYSDINLGCKKRVSSGIDWAFKLVEEAIILEDDCLPHPSFFQFCQEMLDKYRNDERIMMISGTNLAWDVSIEGSHYFSRYPHIWGWATWRRVWCKYDVEMSNLQILLADDNFKKSFETNAEYRHWADVLGSVYNSKVDTWDAQIAYLAFSGSQLTVYPSGNLISNIGFGPDATHTFKKHKYLSNLPFKLIPENSVTPIFIIPSIELEKIRKNKECIGVNKYYWYFKNFILGN